jgi:truncated hemoglobin YjbI
LLDDFNEKVGREDILKLKTGNEFYKINNDDDVRSINSATTKKLSRVQCFHIITLKNALSSPDWKTQNHIHPVMIERLCH